MSPVVPVNPTPVDSPVPLQSAIPQQPIVPSVVPEPTPVIPSSSRKRKIWKVILIIVGVFIAVMAIVFALIMSITNAPVKVANEQFADIKAGNLQSAYDLFSNATKTQVSLEQFEAFVEKYQLNTSDVSISFSGRSITNGQAQLDGKVTVNEGSVPLRYKLIEDNGVWKVLSFEVNPQN